MKHYSFYHKDTGLVHGILFSTDDPTQVAGNTPPDHLVLGGHHVNSRVDMQTGEVVPHQPAAPSPDHVWVDQRWVLSDAAIHRQNSMARIRFLEATQVRPLREAMLGNPSGLAKLKQIDDEISAIRADLLT